MISAESKKPLSMTPSKVVLGLGLLFAIISLAQWGQTPWSAWQTRPAVTCEQGDETHRTGQVSADRVNVRSLPTVFSEVVKQVGEGHPVVVVCQFGAWSQVVESDMNEVTWISSGLINLDTVEPLSLGARIGLIASLILSIGMIALGVKRPRVIDRSVAWLLQTGDLPDHAKPLIFNPNTQNSQPQR